MREPISPSFNEGQKQYIAVTTFGATLTDDDKNKFKTTFDKGSLKSFLILIICNLDNSLESPWVLVQQHL